MTKNQTVGWVRLESMALWVGEHGIVGKGTSTVGREAGIVGRRESIVGRQVALWVGEHSIMGRTWPLW